MLCSALLVSCSDNTADKTTLTPEASSTITAQTATPTPSEVPKTTPDYSGPAYTVTYKSSTSIGGTIKGEAVQSLRANQPSSEVEAIPAEGYKFYQWSDGEKTPSRSGDTTSYDKDLIAYFVLDLPEFKAPTINITTDDEEPVLSKEYTTATITVVDSEGGKHDGTFQTRIKGRGNSSWSSSAAQTSYNSKNSYRLKLDESQKFLGIGDSKNKDWVLNSCKFDASLLRNYIGFRMGELFDGIDYSPECTWAHVYINGDYRGVYMVTEFIEVANDRVAIDDTIENPDNGFLIELDMRGNLDGTLEVDYFYIDGYAENESNAREWVIKSDLSLDPDMAVAQFNFIKEYMQSVHNAIEKGNHDEIESLIDMDSFVDMFICSEVSKEVDVNTASFYMYKPAGGKLHLTAPWDYDFAFGTYGVSTSIGGLVTTTSSGNQWFAKLLEYDWFVKLVLERMEELTPVMEKLCDEIVGVGFSLTSTADENASKWNLWANHYHGYVSIDVSAALMDYEMHIMYLNDWLYWRWQLIIFELEEYI